jgi:AcrR family transcriptional regulator/DNA-binding MarR family transcriptional regulator
MSSAGRVDRNGLVSRRSTLARNGLRGEGVAEIQRARILVAMTEVACERGPANVTVGHVVERAGISRRTFYELFNDREECLLVALDEAIARATGYVLDAYAPDVRWTERIRTALAALLSFLDAERGMGWLLIVGSLGAGATALERRKRVLAQMIAVVDEGRGEIRTGHDLPPLTAEGVVGAVFSVIHGRMVEEDDRPLVELVNPLMSMVTMPYLGAAAARRELEKPVPKPAARPMIVSGDPLRGLAMRITYRTVRVLVALAESPGSSNRQLGEAAGIGDQGQISKLLGRLGRLGLVENTGPGHRSGERNVWSLTPKGYEVERAVAAHAYDATAD